MSKEPFDRNKPHCNIGDIAKSVEVTDAALARSIATMQASLPCDQEIIDRANQMFLENLIEAYGEEEGTKIFTSMQPVPYADYQQLDDENAVGHSHGRR